MIKKIVKNKRFMEIFRFCVTGGLSFLVDWGIMVFLKEAQGVHYLWASGVSFGISVVFNYFLCRFWVFEKTGKQTLVSVLLFVGSSVVGLGLTQFLMWALVDRLTVNYMIAKVVVTLIVMIWNYVMKRLAVYRFSRKDNG